MKVAPQLSALEAAGLVRLAAIEPEVEYLFRHVLIQEAAYGSVLRQERRKLHALVADALEALHPGGPVALAPVLALHLHEAGEAARAVPYLLVSGREAAARFAVHEARAAYDRALNDLEGLEATGERRRQRVEAVLGAVKAGWNFSPWDQEITSLENVLPVADEVGDLRLLAEVHFWIAYLRRGLGEAEATSPALRRSLERSAEIGRELGDESIGAIPRAFAAMGMLFGGQIRAALIILEGLLPVVKRHGDPMGAAMIAEALPLGYARLGEFAEAERTAAEADAIAREADLMAILDGQILHAYIDLERGELDRAAQTAAECREQADDAGALSCAVLSNFMLGMAGVVRGDLGAARPALERAREIAQAASAFPWRNRVLGALHWTRAMLGEEEASSLAGLDGSIEAAHRSGEPWDEGTLLTLRGTVRARSDESREEGLRDFAAAEALLGPMGARPALIRTLRAWADALDASGRGNEAAETRTRANSLAAEIGFSQT